MVKMEMLKQQHEPNFPSESFHRWLGIGSLNLVFPGRMNQT